MLMSMQDPAAEPAPKVREKVSFQVVVDAKFSVVDWLPLKGLLVKGPRDKVTPSEEVNCRLTALPEATPGLKLPEIDSVVVPEIPLVVANSEIASTVNWSV